MGKPALAAVLGIAVGACGVERLTAVELVGAAGSDAAAMVTDASVDAVPDAPSSGNDGAASTCALSDAACVAENSSCNVGSYLLFDNQDNCGADSGNMCGQESAYGCADSDDTVSFVVTSEQAAGNTAVLSYSSMQMIFNDPKPQLSSFSTITSTFAETSPHVGSYDDTYDIWLNGIAEMGISTLIAVWVDSFDRTPAGTLMTTTTALDRPYTVWTDSNGYTFVPSTPLTSGTVDLRQILDWASSQGWLGSDPTVWQIEFGVEIASTGGAPATFQFSDFSITTH